MSEFFQGLQALSALVVACVMLGLIRPGDVRLRPRARNRWVDGRRP